MLRLVVRRLLQLIPTLLGLSVLLFLWLNRLPGGPASAILGERATPTEVARINRALGLDQPVWVQYGRFLKRIFELDLGTSTKTGQPVWDEFALRFPATVELSVMAMLIAVVVGIPLGYLAAKRRGGWLDVAAVSGSLVGICVPVFFLALILKGFFAVNLGLFPSYGRLTTGLDATDVTGFAVLDGILTGEFDATLDALHHLALPAITLASIPLAVIVRMTRASVLEVLGEDYVRTAESKGLEKNTVRVRHVLRNALLPVVTAIGLLTGSLLSGAVLTESVFSFGGIGSFIKDAIDARDYPVLVGFIMFIAMVYVVINLLVDLAYSLIDPRVRVN
ncbi:MULTISPECIES: ABC transporter permease [Streptomyces]|uniref:Dipeptide transport system permease protein DppB n=2 Tax=Streptomyces TaxID=1883 RepID=A0A1D8G6Y3_9ACTN|nr:MULTISPECIES: ABC transporter permease [Streptomyces]AOT61168.1 Dipeptide transport system permease protein DppB [Streptomyces rubrolavendulae]KAF0650166.1 peptide ABC transporter permease [Streptomyces fradiae ATCC 10745 = DSM 40063]OSY51940.1 Dipeptide transport system permease protein DppB [Streptomyces fradiae ATCC 10745 = DSM 40063]QEV14194.1 ABC transporter permease [Streptomyces fradiae ATCC 10745 = DSM 40063]UQS30576.1 ABC transporter permease [Streptomyces fradiae]